MKEYEKRVYIVPLNFATEGKTFFGMNLRNILEAAVIFIILIIPVIIFIPSLEGKIYGVIVCAVPTGVALVGINGLSVTSYLSDMINYRACNRVYAKPTPESVLVRERQIIQEKHRILKEKEKRERKQKKEATTIKKVKKRQMAQEKRVKGRKKNKTKEQVLG